MDHQCSDIAVHRDLSFDGVLLAAETQTVDASSLLEPKARGHRRNSFACLAGMRPESCMF